MSGKPSGIADTAKSAGSAPAQKFREVFFNAGNHKRGYPGRKQKIIASLICPANRCKLVIRFFSRSLFSPCRHNFFRA